MNTKHLEYVEWIKNNRPDYEVLDEYKNIHTHLLHRYKPLNLEWKVTPRQFKSGTSHPDLKLINKTKKSKQEYIKWIKKNRPEYELVGEYFGIKNKTLHRHIQTGYQWEVTPEHIKQGVNHPKLQKTNKLTHQEYIQWVKENRPDYEVIEEYQNTKTKILHRHIETGHQWKVTPKSFKEGTEHPEVQKLNGNKKVGITHEQYVEWIEQNRPDYEVLDQYVNDTIKLTHLHIDSGYKWKVSPKKFKRRTKPDSREIAIFKNKSLYTASPEDYEFWVSENRPDYKVLEPYVDLNTPIEHVHVESNIAWKVKPRIFKRYNKPDSSEISFFKRKKNIKYTTEFYSRWIFENRPDYEIIEEYINYNTKIKHKHIETGKVWLVSPRHFKLGRSHPDISTTTGKWTHNRYINWLKNNKSEYECLEQYVSNRTPILHKHIPTGTTWKISPSNLKSGSMYPKEHNHIRREMLSNQYVDWVNKNRPDYRVLEDYHGSYAKILHEHIETGLKWYISPMCFKRGVQHPSLIPSGWSRIAVEWLTEMEQVHECKIQHMQNGGEITLPDIGKVDGFCKDTNTVYQFHGDFWHGNPFVYEGTDINSVNKKTFGELFDNTVQRDELIVSLGYSLFVVWQSDYMEGSLGSYFE